MFQSPTHAERITADLDTENTLGRWRYCVLCETTTALSPFEALKENMLQGVSTSPGQQLQQPKSICPAAWTAFCDKHDLDDW